MHNFNKLLDKKYNVIPCYLEKGFSNETGMQLIIKVDGIEIGKQWYQYGHKPIDTDRSKSKTGGKASYCMLMEKELDKLLTGKKADPEILGYVLTLVNKTSWHTGILKYKRKKKPICFEDLIDIFGKGRKKTAEIVGKLKEYGILQHDKDGYKLARTFIKKGGTKNEINNV